MNVRTVILENTYFRNVLYVIEDLLWQIPHPAYIWENPGRKSITKYTFQEPVRKDDFEKQSGRITINYSQTTTTEYAAMAGLVMEKDPIVFECYQDWENKVEVKGYCTARKESLEWMLPIFENIWQKLLETFSG
jgi:hypothetical protein